jgi:hypothetical protein
MKRLIWLLVSLNIGLLVYFNLEQILPSTPTVMRPEIRPERVHLPTAQEIATMPQPTEKLAPLPVQTACYQWGVFSGTRIVAAETTARQLGLSPTLKELIPMQARRFWVYRPPLKSAEEAQAKAAELKALGVENLQIVQEPPWKNAISFGVFADEFRAIKLLNDLKAKGVNNVQKSLRNQGGSYSSLQFTQLTADNVAALLQLKPNFPEASLEPAACN